MAGAARVVDGFSAILVVKTGSGPTLQAKIKVLLAAPSLGYLGGQAVQAGRMMEGFRNDPECEVRFQPHDPGLGAFDFLTRIKYVRTVARQSLYLLQLLVRIPQVDVVHTFSASYWSFVLAPSPAVWIAWLFGKPVIVNYRSGEAADHLEHWKRSAYPVLRRTSAIVTPSRYLVEVFAEFGFSAEVIPNVIDTARFPFVERERLESVFLSNRNFEAHYDVANTLRAFALIQREVPEARLLVAGDGPERAMLEALAAELGLRQTEFLGAVTNARMAELCGVASIYLNSSRIDNMPGSLLEAFAAGMAVVSTNAGGIPWVVDDGKTGMLVPCGEPERMAGEALRLLRDEAAGRRLVAQAREEVKRYAWPAVRAQWLGLYRRLAKR